MSALTGPRINFANKATLGRKLGRASQTGKTFFNGAMVAIDSTGYLKPNDGTTGDKIRGCVDLKNHASVATTGAVDTAGCPVLEVIDGIFPFAIGGGGDALTKAMRGNKVFGIDDQTVGATDGGTGRPIAGELVDLETLGGVAIAWVGIGVYWASSSPSDGAAPGSVDAVAAAGPVSADTAITELTVVGTKAYTIPAPLFAGQRKTIVSVAVSATPIATLTSAASHGWTTISGLGALGATIKLIATAGLTWDIDGGLLVTVA